MGRKSIHEKLSRRSDELAERMVNTHFFNLNRDEQLFVIDDVLQPARTAYHKFSRPAHEVPIAVEGTRAYARVASCDLPTYQPVDIAETTITGALTDLSVLERPRLLAGLRLYAPASMINAAAGLCLSVILAPTSVAALNCAQRDVVFGVGDQLEVPISGQDIDVVFGSSRVGIVEAAQ